MRVTGVRVSLVALACAVLGGAPAFAAPTPSPAPASPGASAAPPPKQGTPVCTITDKNASQISGMAISNGVLYAVNDSADSDAKRKVFRFNPATCAAAGAPIGYPKPPNDPEDLAVDAQGTMWIADTGDDPNAPKRTTITVWKLADNKITGPFRMAYPGGKKYDAEAMLIGNDGLPIIITKVPEPFIFVPTGPLVENSTNGVPLKEVGKVVLPKSNTDNPLQALGRIAVTGAAISPDRTKVVLRTYADAFEWTITDNDIVKSITTGKPKITPLPLPGELFGESITYTADGKNFLTLSDMEHVTAGKKNELLSYVPNTVDPNAAPSNVAAAPKPATNEKSWFSSLLSSTDRLYMLIGSVGVLGALFVLFGVIGIRRSRKRRRQEEKEEAARAMNEPDPYYDQGYGYQDPAYGYPEEQQRGRVYGSPQHGYGDQPQYPNQQYPDPQYPQYPQQPQYPPGTYGSPNYGGYPDQGDQGYGQPPYR